MIQIGVVALAPSLLAAPYAWADAEDTVNVSAGVTVQHDDNVFRLPSGTDSRAVLGESTKADDITTTTLALKMNKRYSLQRFQLEASLVDYRYKTFDYLDFTARNYLAAWRWSITPRFHGNLSSDRKEALNSFSDFTGYGVRNVRTDENKRLDGTFEVSGSWRLVGGVARSTRTNSELFIEESDTRLDIAEAGVRYDFPSGSSLGYLTRSGRGEYLKRPQPLASTLLDNRFDQRENEVRLVWPITVKTTVDTRLGYVERDHAHFGQRDYSGNFGNLDVTWNVTEKTSLMAGVGRELASYQSAASSYVTSDRFSIGPIWQISAKTTLRGRYDYIRRDYHGAVTDTALGDRTDNLRSALIALEWQPLRTVFVSASLQKGWRKSNQPAHDYDHMIAGVSAQMTF